MSENYADVYEVLCNATIYAHTVQGLRDREDSVDALGLTLHIEDSLQPILESSLQDAGGEYRVIHEEAYPGEPIKGGKRGKRNDFTIHFHDERRRLFLELKTPWIFETGYRWNKLQAKSGKYYTDSLPYAVRIKLPRAEPPYGLLVMGCSPHAETETDKLVQRACTTVSGKWDNVFDTFKIEEGLGYANRKSIQLSKLYLFLKT